jgi:hypothetical protein
MGLCWAPAAWAAITTNQTTRTDLDNTIAEILLSLLFDHHDRSRVQLVPFLIAVITPLGRKNFML